LTLFSFKSEKLRAAHTHSFSMGAARQWTGWQSVTATNDQPHVCATTEGAVYPGSSGQS